MEENVVRFRNPTPINSLANYWIRDYRAKRYLQGLNKSDLLARDADIASNMMALRDDGKYHPRFSIRKDKIYAGIRNLDYLRMATDAWEEMRFRGYEPLPRLDRSRLQIAKRLSDESWCRRAEWISNSRLSIDKYEQPHMLFKFSEKRWNKELIELGRIRISPASKYNDTSAINAVRDNELSLEWYDDRLNRQVLETKDYFCLCLSSEYDYRLFSDFRSDSCVAIKKPAEFSERLRTAVQRHNEEQPRFGIVQLIQCPIIYVDPFALLPPQEASEVQFCKYFRFAYQTEYRFVLIPTNDRQLEPFFLQLGSITDIAEIVIAP